jgi:putative N-acetylmannosamine-6-phosphate epimerase
MADIASMTTAMKARAKAAIDAIEEDTHSYTTRTPLELRFLILRQDESVRAAMEVEGWFITPTETDAAGYPTFVAASNQAVDVS